MTIDIKIPEVGESIQEIQIGKWLKREGDIVERDENVVSLETDKASLDLPAPRRGVLKQILKQEGDTTTVGDVIARLEETDEAAPKEADAQPASDGAASEKPPQAATQDAKKDRAPRNDQKSEHAADAMATPAARRALREHHLSMQDVRPEGGRIELSDVERFVESHAKDETSAKSSSPAPAERKPAQTPATFASAGQNDRELEASLESVVPMTLIRKRIAQRLVQAQQNAALLTTFNEIDMSGVLKLREQYGEKFKNRYGIKLGFMSFFVKAAVDALRLVPEINAEIRDNKIIYRNYYHIGIAIGSERGLVVPVLRFTERMSFAEIEQAIGEFARRANDNKLEPYDLEGGTFTISNGGVYGSLLSTPIVNPPQSGVLGLHSIQERPIAVAGEVVIRPMMYVALSYDHRIVDGREAVTFLRRIKDAVEDPARMIVEI